MEDAEGNGLEMVFVLVFIVGGVIGLLLGLLLLGFYAYPSIFEKEIPTMAGIEGVQVQNIATNYSRDAIIDTFKAEIGKSRIMPVLCYKIDDYGYSAPSSCNREIPLDGVEAYFEPNSKVWNVYAEFRPSNGEIINFVVKGIPPLSPLYLEKSDLMSVEVHYVFDGTRWIERETHPVYFYSYTLTLQTNWTSALLKTPINPAYLEDLFSPRGPQ